MKTVYKRVISLLIALTLVVGVLPCMTMESNADNNKCGDNLTWSWDGNGTLTISGTGAMHDYNGTDNKAPWNAYIGSIETVIINDGVTSIGNYAFYECTALQSVSIANSVKSIGITAFGNCESLTSIKLPYGLETIESGTFANCIKLESIMIPSTVTTVGTVTGAGLISFGTFANCTSLGDVVLDKQTQITEDAFLGLDINLIQVSECGYCGNPAVNYGRDIIWYLKEDGTLTISGTGAMADWSSVSAPWDAVKGNIKKINIEEGVTSIGPNAFSVLPQLVEVTIPKSVTAVGTEAFAGCENLSAVTIDKALKEECDNSVFSNCPKLNASGYTYYTYNISYATNGVGNGKVTGNATSVPGSSCSLNFTSADGYVVTEVTYTDKDGTAISITPDEKGRYRFNMPNCDTTVTAIFGVGGYCGTVNDGKNLKWTYADGTLTISGTGAMADFIAIGSVPWHNSYHNKISKIVIEDGVTTIGDYAFSDCGILTDAQIPDSVTSVGFYAFGGCSKLESISIPACVAAIGAKAFMRCSSLTSVEMDKSLKAKCDADRVFLDCTIPESGFKYYTYGITYTNDGNGTVSGPDKSPSTDTIALTFTPNANYTVDKVTFKDSKGTTTITPDASGNYSFVMPIEAVTVNATFVPMTPKTVTFADEDGTVLQSGLVDCGTTPVYTGALPAKAETDTYTYTFAGWDDGTKTYGPTDALPAVTADVTYTAVFTETAKPTPPPSPSPSPEPTPEPTPGPVPPAEGDIPSITGGKAHIQDIGDVTTYVEEGEFLVLGTTGESKRLESITLYFDNPTNYSGTLEYRVHVQDIGWTDWVTAGNPAGTTGQAKRIEAIEIRLTGELADYYSVYYCVHIQDYGEMQDWVQDGALAGTTGESKRIEALGVVIIPKGSEDNISVKYRVHVQDLGWESTYASDGSMAGTSGQSKRLEGIEMFITGCPYSGGIQYKTHIQDIGWESGWTKNGEMSGTQGQSKRLEGIAIELYGEVAEYYDIYYRVHAQDIGWMGWAKNGEYAGTAGRSARLEGIQIVLVPKGDPAPGATYEGITSVTDQAFIEGF